MPGLYMIGYGKRKINLKFPSFCQLNEENKEWGKSKVMLHLVATEIRCVCVFIFSCF